MRSIARSRRRGFTLIEVLITIGVFTLVGGLIFYVLNSAMTLYAKNTAVNAAHQQARAGVDEMLANIHASVSIPELMEITGTGSAARFTPLAQPGTGPALGLSFQRFDGGPFSLTKAVKATDTSITVNVGADYVPRPTMRFNIPSHNLVKDMSKTTEKKNGTTWTISFSDANNKPDPVGQAIDYSAGHIVTGFTTYRSSYAVLGGELRYYPITPNPDDTTPNFDINDPKNYKVIARNVTTTLPFKILLNADGGVDNRSVAAVKLATKEPQYDQRGYAAVNMFINSYIPFRSQLTDVQ